MLFLQLKSLGFNYNFNALSGDAEENELMKAFSKIFETGPNLNAIKILQAIYPVLSFLVRISIVASPFFFLIYIGLQLPAPIDAVTQKAVATMNDIGMGLLKETKSDKTYRKDILSVLAKANTVEAKVNQMKDEDVMSRA
jgi:hypothetical protein